MIWNSFSDFFHMGGYALYVWGSVIVTFGFMVTELIILKLRQQAIIDHLGRTQPFGEEEIDEVVEKERDETAS